MDKVYVVKPFEKPVLYTSDQRWPQSQETVGAPQENDKNDSQPSEYTVSDSESEEEGVKYPTPTTGITEKRRRKKTNTETSQELGTATETNLWNHATQTCLI